MGPRYFLPARTDTVEDKHCYSPTLKDLPTGSALANLELQWLHIDAYSPSSRKVDTIVSKLNPPHVGTSVVTQKINSLIRTDTPTKFHVKKTTTHCSKL